MGSFVGHLLPGLLYIGLGIQWFYSLCMSHFSCPHERQSKNRLLSPPSELSQSINYHQTISQRTSTKQPIEALSLIFLLTIGVLGEFITGFEHGTFTHYSNLQHITMYVAWIIATISSLLCHYKVTGVPKGFDYLTFALALFIEGLLFTFHLHGRSPLDIIVHQFLIIVIVVSFFTILLEWKHMNSQLATIFRIYLAVLQGSWFIQVGFILYNPIPGSIPWADHDHGQLMIATCIFCLHILFDFMAVFAVYIFTYRFDPIMAFASYKELPIQDILS